MTVDVERAGILHMVHVYPAMVRSAWASGHYWAVAILLMGFWLYIPLIGIWGTHYVESDGSCRCWDWFASDP